MSELRRAAEVLRNQAKKFEVYTRAAAELERVANLEGYVAEKERLLAELAGRHDEAKAELQATQDKIGEAKSEAAKLAADARAQAKSILADAEAKVQIESARIVSAARSEAEAERTRLEALKKEAADVESRRDCAKAELEDMNAKLAQARASARSLLEAAQ